MTEKKTEKEPTELEKARILVIAEERKKDAGFIAEYEVLCKKWNRMHNLIPARLGVIPYYPGK